jgi:hypothetical protein
MKKYGRWMRIGTGLVLCVAGASLMAQTGSKEPVSKLPQPVDVRRSDFYAALSLEERVQAGIYDVAVRQGGITLVPEENGRVMLERKPFELVFTFPVGSEPVVCTQLSANPAMVVLMHQIQYSESIDGVMEQWKRFYENFAEQSDQIPDLPAWHMPPGHFYTCRAVGPLTAVNVHVETQPFAGAWSVWQEEFGHFISVERTQDSITVVTRVEQFNFTGKYENHPFDEFPFERLYLTPLASTVHGFDNLFFNPNVPDDMETLLLHPPLIGRQLVLDFGRSTNAAVDVMNEWDALTFGCGWEK